MEETTRGVTIRELGRHAAGLLDDIERTGRGVVISRYGRAVAYLGPLPDDYEPGAFDRVHILPRSHATSSLLQADEIDDAVGVEVVEHLNERDRAFMNVLDSFDGMWWMPSSDEHMLLREGWFELELRDLVESRSGGGLRLTSKGKRAVAMLKLAS